MAADRVLTPAELAFLDAARTAVLATIGRDGRPRLVPICFVLAAENDELRVYSPLDEKPKTVVDPLALGRVRDILADPAVSLLIDHWSEDWSQLGWLRLEGRADLITADAADDEAEHAAGVVALRAKYPQYSTHFLEGRPIIRIAIERGRSWGSLEPGP